MSTGVPMPFVKRQFFTSTGAVANGYKLNVYLTGSSTRTPTYTSSDLAGSQNANPVVLDTAGQATIYLDPAITYKFVLTDAAGAIEWTENGVPGNVPASAPWTLSMNSIGATSTDVLVLSNSAVAANAAQQYSPRVRWTGAGWNATASASRVVDFLAEVRPVQQGSGDPVGTWVLLSQVNGGGYTPRCVIDSSGNISVTGVSTVSGFGSSNYSAGGTGGNIVSVSNTAAGTGNYAAWSLGNDLGGVLGQLRALSSTFTTVGSSIANAIAFYSAGAGGLSVGAEHASGVIRFYTGGSTERARLTATGGLALGTTTDPGLGGINVSGVEMSTGSISPAQITSNTNNYGPSGWASANVVKINTDAARDITGFVAVASGTRILLVNDGAFTVTFKNDSGSSSAGNRIYTPSAVDYSFVSRSAIWLFYNTDHWAIIG